ncbi:hypothetical protein [Aliikangiella coralliicola]|nr:hypothetical protein [Aliikangiella coralliicola]
MTIRVAVAEKLNEDSKRIESAYNQLQLRQDNVAFQQAYLDAFPKTAKSFNQVFNPPNRKQLFDGNKYIFLLESLSENHLEPTLALTMKLACNLQWKSGAPDYLQLVLIKIAVNNPIAFAKGFKPMGPSQRTSLVEFLAAGQKGPAPGYERLIEILRRIGYPKVADQLFFGLSSID